MKKAYGWIVTLAFIAVVVIGYETVTEHRQQNHAISIILGDTETGQGGLLKKNRELAPAIAAQFRDYKTNSILWSAAYHTSLYFSALLSVLATLVLKIESFTMDDKRRKDLAAVLAALGGLLITVSTAGDFQAKWQASRMAAAKTASLAFDALADEKTDISPKVIAELQSIFLLQNQAIVGDAKKSGLLSDVPKSQAASPPAEAGKSGDRVKPENANQAAEPGAPKSK